MRRPPQSNQQKARVRVTDETRAKLSERSRDWWIRHRGAMSEHMESRKSPITLAPIPAPKSVPGPAGNLGVVSHGQLAGSAATDSAFFPNGNSKTRRAE